ncbi:MAG: Y-family DNA polymerase [Mailhella sp.]|nr:Y-family DNA polymerase [Mailhella sp.]
MSSTKFRSLFLLIDCNNFYVSCERLFRPDLRNKPVVVLSNNDGCIVSRSQEVKALGIPMGEPEFKARPLIQKHGIEVFSSNYELYGDISDRVMLTISSVIDEVEQYSIDECFVRLAPAHFPNALDIAREIRERVFRWTGITVSVGIAQTRTLAKLANHIAKKGRSGVFFLNGTDAQHDALFKKIPVSEVWGIGSRTLPKLERFAIKTVYDLKHAEDNWVRSRLTVTGWRTVLELRGIPSIDEDNSPTPRRTLVSSRSFGTKIYEKAALQQAVTAFATRAAEKLRWEGLFASGIAVHIRTSRQQIPFVSETVQLTFVTPTCDTEKFIKAAIAGVEAMFRPGTPYAKAGIMLFDLTAKGSRQGSLLNLSSEADERKRTALMSTLDKINSQHGRHTLRYAAEGLGEQVWHMNQNHRSPRRTTEWKELATVACRDEG